MNAPTNTSAAIQPTPSNGARRKALTGVSIAVLIGLTWGGYEWYIGRHEESTDNAYVQGNVIQITPKSAARSRPSWPMTPTSSRPDHPGATRSR